MSNQVHFKGKLLPVTHHLGLDAACELVMFETTGRMTLSDPEGTWEHQLTEDLPGRYVIINDALYAIDEYEIPTMDVFTSNTDPEGHINFEVSYYDGSCSHNEALEQALANGTAT